MAGLDALIEFNRAEADTSMPYFQQEIFEKAAAMGPLTDEAYQEALARIRETTRDNGVERAFQTHNLDALIAPTEGPAWSIDLVNGDHFLGGFSTFAAVGGYPHVTLPMGTLHGLPVGMSFVGLRDADVRVLALAHAFEAAGIRHEVGAPLLIAPGQQDQRHGRQQREREAEIDAAARGAWKSSARGLRRRASRSSSTRR